MKNQKNKRPSDNRALYTWGNRMNPGKVQNYEMVVSLTLEPSASVIVIGHTRGTSAEQVAERIQEEITSTFPKNTEITNIGLECREKTASNCLAWEYLDVRVGEPGNATRKILTDENKTGVSTKTILEWLLKVLGKKVGHLAVLATGAS
jgi:hypothetical protein